MSINNAQRQLIRERANDCCEYCRLSQSGRLVRFQVDHIIARKHGGTDIDSNLSLDCYECNIYKGSNVAALDPLTGDAAKIYHPRQQTWVEHFRINSDGTLAGLTPEGRTTIAVLRINNEERVKQRLGESTVGDYPCKKD